MDIPQVLEQICPEKEWGPCANTGNTYEQFIAYWPKKNGTAPTKEEMETIWAQIQSAKKTPKTKDELISELGDWASDASKVKELVVALMADRLMANPKYLDKFGIPISGEKS